jgi:hypothetical protein
MSTRNISWEVKAAGAYGWQPYHLHVKIFLKSRGLGTLGACPAVYRDSFTFSLMFYHTVVLVSVRGSLK